MASDGVGDRDGVEEGAGGDGSVGCSEKEYCMVIGIYLGVDSLSLACSMVKETCFRDG